MNYETAERTAENHRWLIGKPIVDAHGKAIPNSFITHLFISPQASLFDAWYDSNQSNKNFLASTGNLQKDQKVFVCTVNFNNVEYFSELTKYLDILKKG